MLNIYACVCAQLLRCVQLFETPMTVAQKAPLSMEFSRQEYWSRLPFPTRGDLEAVGIEAVSLASAAFDRQILYRCTTWEGQYICTHLHAQSLQLCLALCYLWTVAFQALLYEIL